MKRTGTEDRIVGPHQHFKPIDAYDEIPIFYVLFVVHCTLHASHVPSLNVLSLSFQKSHRLTLVDQDFCHNTENVYRVCRVRVVYR